MIDKAQGNEIRKITLALMLVISGLSLLVFQGSFQSITLGIIIGAMCGLLRFVKKIMSLLLLISSIL